MDEITISALIAEGESSRVEFKRELDLTYARNKAEFIKDLIALANSAIETGYLIIGVDNSKTILGVADLPEEQIQQVALTYITPPITLTYHVVPMSRQNFVSVGILEVKPTQKPHKAARTIESLTQNKVFIRHGSVVAEASPEEIISMRDATQASGNILQYMRAAKTHTRLGNYDNAIQSYSRAIDITPTAELFIARGDIYEHLSRDSDDQDKWEQLAYKDFSDASRLATSLDVEKAARLRRWHVYNPGVPSDPRWESFNREKEIEWLKSYASGSELGELLFFELKQIRDNTTLFDQLDAVAKLDEVLRLGFSDARVYALRAEAQYIDCNFGLALNDVDTAINASIYRREIAEYFFLRASILSRMQNRNVSYPEEPFEMAYDNVRQGAQILGYERGMVFSFDWELSTEVLYRCVLSYLVDKGNLDLELNKALVRTLAVWFGDIHNTHPKIARIIREMVGEDFWQMHNLG